VESVLKKKKKGYDGKHLKKRKVLSPEMKEWRGDG